MSEKTSQTPLEKFKRLAQARSNAAKKQFKLLKNLAASAYDIDETMAQEIVETLSSEIEELKVKWKLVENPNKRKKKTVEVSEKESGDPELLTAMVD